MTMQDGIRAVQQAIVSAAPPPRWPICVRQAKQFLRQSIEDSTNAVRVRQSSICCERQGRKACCALSAIGRLRFACFREPTSLRSAWGRGPIDIDDDGGRRGAA